MTLPAYIRNPYARQSVCECERNAGRSMVTQFSRRPRGYTHNNNVALLRVSQNNKCNMRFTYPGAESAFAAASARTGCCIGTVTVDVGADIAPIVSLRLCAAAGAVLTLKTQPHDVTQTMKQMQVLQG